MFDTTIVHGAININAVLNNSLNISFVMILKSWAANRLCHRRMCSNFLLFFCVTGKTEIRVIGNT